MASSKLAIGIDVGASSSTTAYVGKTGKIDVILNEASKRSTPSVVIPHGEEKRLVGEEANTSVKKFVDGAVRNFKQLLGKSSFETPDNPSLTPNDIQEEVTRWGLAELVDSLMLPGYIAANIPVQGQGKKQYTIQQLFAMLIHQLVKQAEKDTNLKVDGVTLSCPSDFADVHRRAMQQACEIAGVQCLRLVNESTAAALAYGMPRKAEFPSNQQSPTGQKVMFVNLGHSSLQVAIGEFWQEGMRVRGDAVCHEVSGRNMDWELMKMLAAKFAKKNQGKDVLQDKKAKFKLEGAVAKLKKTLSTNADATANVDYIVGDRDLAETITRDEFEAACKPMMSLVQQCLQQSFERSGLTDVREISKVELIGGSSRVPWFKAILGQTFGEQLLSYTLNAEECIAIGCAYAAAMASPLYQTKDFGIEQTLSSRGVEFSWPRPRDPNGPHKVQPLFNQSQRYGEEKPLSFSRDKEFTVRASYADGSAVPPGTRKRFAEYHIPIDHYDHKHQVKVRVGIDNNGLFETDQYVQVVPDDRNVPEGKRQKMEYKVVPSLYGVLNGEQMKECRHTEAGLREQENAAEAVSHARNDLEKFVLEAQNKFREQNNDFGQPGELSTYRDVLHKMDEWLWNPPSSDLPITANKVKTKLQELQKMMGRTLQRIVEHDERDNLRAELVQSVDKFLQKMHNERDTIDALKASNFQKMCMQAKEWVVDGCAKQAQMPKNADPVILINEIKQRIDGLDEAANGIFIRRSRSASPAPPGAEL